MSAHLKALRQVDPVLTQLAIGYRQATFIGEQVMPVVNVEKDASVSPHTVKPRLSNTKLSARRTPHPTS